MAIHVAQIQVSPAKGSAPVVSFWVTAESLRDPEVLGVQLTEAVLECLAKGVEKLSGGIIVPCRFCAANMKLISTPEGRGLTCPTPDCRGAEEFYPVP